MDPSSLSSFLNQQGYPAYRYRQILKNYLSARPASFLEMTDLPKPLRHQLDSNFKLSSLSLSQLQPSQGAVKAKLQLSDGQMIESVLMDYDQWYSVCLSTQVGCPLGCRFCATGQMGFIRKLTAEEIIDQVHFWNNYLYQQSPESSSKVDRLVFMGMGEPFLNWSNLILALDFIRSPQGWFVGQRKISISTAGIIPQIENFTNLDTQINLAVSLHSLNQSVRSEIMPISRQYPLDDLLSVCHQYTQKTRRQLFFEYALIRGVNDRPSDLSLLIKLLKSNHLFFLNLIPLNLTSHGMLPSLPETVNLFTQSLSKLGLNYSLRRSFGSDIQAACGQLIVNPKLPV
jgi:23S rRNA (adenine2503-C2)-methyltransferase